jgi:Domain of unknown function (DUF4145)
MVERAEDSDMSMTNLDCPHCLREAITCDLIGAAPIDPPHWALAFQCRRCRKPIGAVAFTVHFHSPADFRAAPYLGRPDITIGECYPAPPAPRVIKGLPVAVERQFREAEENRFRDNRESAGMMYRKAMDTALDELVADKQERDRRKRILKMVEQRKLTPDLGDWANEVRLLGNEAGHEPDAHDKADIADLAHFTRMLLIYLFEMPQRIAAMRARRAET